MQLSMAAVHLRTLEASHVEVKNESQAFSLISTEKSQGKGKQ
jgi:hypothetical protein